MGKVTINHQRGREMASREEILRSRTHKDDGLKLEERVFYTLTDERGSDRLCKAVSLLIAWLRDREVLNDDDIDAILLETVGGEAAGVKP